MCSAGLTRVGYVLKRYPRYSETFIVNEILAHEAAGLELAIFSLLQPNDSHFQDTIVRVRAPVHYLPAEGLKADVFWNTLQSVSAELPGLWQALPAARGEDIRHVYQALLLAQEARRQDFDHLHAHFATSATTVARLAARFAGLPYSFTAHAKDIFHESVQPEDLRGKLGDAAAAITVSNYNRDYLRQRYAPEAAHVERVYNGLNLDRFAYTSPHERPRRIVAVGRLVEKKGFDDLLVACALIAALGYMFDCRIVGSGPLEGELRAQIDCLGLARQVVLIGPRPLFEISALVQDAAVFAAPCVIGADSNRDSLPMELLEAMALGTACVATNISGIPELVRDGKTGLLVPQRNPAMLALALARLLDDPALRVALATAARRLIEAEFEVGRNSARLRAIFQQVCQARTGELEALSSRAVGDWR
jgi:colanic acid/amylovoran biosynthesis glycosyltransferase